MNSVRTFVIISVSLVAILAGCSTSVVSAPVQSPTVKVYAPVVETMTEAHGTYAIDAVVNVQDEARHVAPAHQVPQTMIFVAVAPSESMTKYDVIPTSSARNRAVAAR
jgi:hypothetical protein